MTAAPHTDQLGDKITRGLLGAVADHGKAAGFEAAAKIIAEMADHEDRVVSTNELRGLVELLKENAKQIRTQADADIAAIDAETKR